MFHYLVHWRSGFTGLPTKRWLLSNRARVDTPGALPEYEERRLSKALTNNNNQKDYQRHPCKDAADLFKREDN